MDDLAYSVFIEKQHSKNKESKDVEPLRYTLPKIMHSWQDDNSTNQCYNCSGTFSLMNRRHHCRFCGKIFCGSCVKFKESIPQDVLSKDSQKGTWGDYFSSLYYNTKMAEHKVCRSCKDTITFINSVKDVIDIFIACELDIKDLKKAGTVCKRWHNASNYILSIFRAIQYKLPDHEYTDLERKLLHINAKYIAGHNRYCIHLIKSCKTVSEYEFATKILYKHRTVKCWSTMCHRNCEKKITPFDAIGLLCYSFKDVGHNDVVKCAALEFMECSDEEFKNYMPLLVYYLTYDNGTISDFLVKRCIDSFPLLNSLYWELQYYIKDNSHSNAYTSVLNKLKELFKNEKYNNSFVKILEGYSFVKMIDNISTEIYDNKKKYEDIKNNFIMKGFLTNPLNSKDQIKEILIDKIKIKNSATKPMVIPCKTKDNKTVNILHKNEDVRKDQIVMNIIRLMDIILKKELHKDFGIATYDILPTGKNSGLIEIINGADTIYYIKQKLNTSITNYIFEKNGNKTVDEVRNSYINSTAAYCAITYLLGIGDRHLNNMMITETGKLFHIDYGYVLGKDPITSNPTVRLTPEMVEAMGGLSSKNYEIFIDRCTEIYNCLRRHLPIFMHLLNMLPKISDLKMSKEDIDKLLIKRFIPGENDWDASEQLIMELERQDYVYTVKDWMHYHAQEETISSAMGRLTYALTKLVTYAAPQEETQSMRKTRINQSKN